MTGLIFYSLGYFIFMWVLVFVLFFTPLLRGAHPQLILLAPLLPLMLGYDFVRSFGEYLKEKRVERAARFIVHELRLQGITVNGEFGVDISRDYHSQGCNWASACDVRAELKPGQEVAYGAVYARAIKAYRHFPWKLTPADLCKDVYPADPLNAAWAKQHGFSEYFAEQFYVPCADCDKVEPFHALQWGENESHTMLWRCNMIIHVPGDPRIVEAGYICRACQMRSYQSFSQSCGRLWKE